MTRYAVGIDVGGTYTDLVAIDDDGHATSLKVLSTPADQSRGVLDALKALGAPGRDVARIAHGTTVATNALLEGTGARVVLCATDGATDLLELRRQERAALYDLAVHHPVPLVPADRVVAVPERIEPQGVTRPLPAAALRRVAEMVRERNPDIVAVALLHAFHDASHERSLGAALRALVPGVEVVLSSDVLPEIREYERTSTTVAEASLRPRVSTYLHRLRDTLVPGGYPEPLVMTSAGGMRHASDAASAAAALALSGPAGGVQGAAWMARQADRPDALTIDIGGTSADAGLVLGGEPLAERGGDVAGVPIALPRVLVETVSAGGGSVAWIDDGGALRVGPRSAGATPGPAAFGRGGTEPTVTDAHVALGSIAAEQLSGGIALDRDAALRSLETLAQRLDAPVERVAHAIITTANAAMARALRRVSIERGVDPRRCVLVAFGGGGPLHGCALAHLLGMTRVLVPPHAGVLSALGLAMAAEQRDAMASVMRLADALSRADVADICEALASRAGEGRERRWWAHARYAGQGHELDVLVDPHDDGPTIARRFAGVHRTRAGFVLDRPVEIVSVRHAARGDPIAIQLSATGVEARSIRGPSAFMLPDAALRVDDGWTAHATPNGGWLLERAP